MEALDFHGKRDQDIELTIQRKQRISTTTASETYSSPAKPTELERKRIFKP